MAHRSNGFATQSVGDGSARDSIGIGMHLNAMAKPCGAKRSNGVEQLGSAREKRRTA